MNIFKKSAKYIIAYLALKWLFIGLVGWQVSQTVWFQNYYTTDYRWWHLFIIPATVLPIILLVKFIKSRAAQHKKSTTA